VPLDAEVAKSDLAFEAGFTEPAFGLLQDPDLLAALFTRLAPFGAQLNDLRVELGSGSVGDEHLLWYLFNYVMTMRVRVDRVEVSCPLPKDQMARFTEAMVETLRALTESDISFRAFAMTVAVHAKLKGTSPAQYLSRFVANAPKALGPLAGNGTVFYFGPEADRLRSDVTVDTSAVVPDAVFFRVRMLLDPKKVTLESVVQVAKQYVQTSFQNLDVNVPM